MPRIYTSANDPIDFCRRCFPKEAKANSLYGNVGDGPDKRGNCFDYDADHPNYEETDYKCNSCRKLLTEKDNYALS